MRIENLARITGGELLNSPFVSSIKGIAFELEKVERGNLFVDYYESPAQHETAVQNGAYAILTASYPKVTDKEIAWLHVKDMELSLIKLARFFASSKDLSFILLSPMQYELAKCLHLDFQTKLLGDSIKAAIFDILHVKEKTLFFVTQEQFIEKIDPTFKQIETNIAPEKIFSKGLFHSSYILNGHFYPELRLPKFLVPTLCALQNFFDKELISYKIESFSNFHHFHPIFVNSFLEKKDFGTSQRVLIFEKEKKFFDRALQYILAETGGEKLSLLLPREYFDEYPKELKKYPYSNKGDFTQLIGESFHYVLVMEDFSVFETPQVTKPIQMNLF